MRHGIAGKKFGRNSSWRKATLRDLARATLDKERICTTKPRAKEARKLVERLITLGKKGTLAGRRRAFEVLCDHQMVSNLFNVIAPRFENRNGGYTRIISLADRRRGDNAEMAYLELTELGKEIISNSGKVNKAKAKLAASSDIEDAEIISEEVEKPKKKSSKSKDLGAADKKTPAKAPKKTPKKTSALTKLFKKKDQGDK